MPMGATPPSNPPIKKPTPQMTEISQDLDVSNRENNTVRLICGFRLNIEHQTSLYPELVLTFDALFKALVAFEGAVRKINQIHAEERQDIRKRKYIPWSERK